MIAKKRTIGLLLIASLLTVGIVSVYAAGSNPLEVLDAQFDNLLSDFGDMWDRIISLESNVDALEARIDYLETEYLPGIGLTYTTRIGFSAERSYIDISEEDTFYVYNYLNNPSLTTKYYLESEGGEGPLDSVDVQYITMNIIYPDGVTEWHRHYSNGDYESYEAPGELFYFEFMEPRWDATVHPGETSLVLYSGWGFSPDWDSIPGIYQYTYELCVVYEGTIYNLVNTFEINVQE